MHEAVQTGETTSACLCVIQQPVYKQIGPAAAGWPLFLPNGGNACWVQTEMGRNQVNRCCRRCSEGCRLPLVRGCAHEDKWRGATLQPGGKAPRPRCSDSAFPSTRHNQPKSSQEPHRRPSRQSAPPSPVFRSRRTTVVFTSAADSHTTAKAASVWPEGGQTQDVTFDPLVSSPTLIFFPFSCHFLLDGQGFRVPS